MTFGEKIVIAYFFLMEMRKVDYLWSVVKFTPKTQKLQFRAAFLWGQFGLFQEIPYSGILMIT